MKKKLSKNIVKLSNPVYVISSYSLAGIKEKEGPLGTMYDNTLTDDMNNEDSWEKAESSMVKEAMINAVKKAGLTEKDIDYCISGDLLNQVSASTFGVRDMEIPFLGIYGACSTFGEAMGIGAMLIDGGFAENILVGASSHFCSAEKQYRAPLGMGNQRPPTTTTTVTGDGAVVLSKNPKGNSPFITEVLTGKITDYGIKDANNMGAAMAPAAAELMLTYFNSTGRKPDYFDLIATGDLGYIGYELAKELISKKGFEFGFNYTDCGIEIFDKDKQDTHCGGSGCACSALVFTAKFHKELECGKIKRMLFMPTGALLSPTTSKQGETIPAIAHGVVIESGCKDV